MESLKQLLESNEDWLMERILAYAIKYGYAAYTSTLKEPWRLSISGITASILDGIDRYNDVPEIGPEEDFSRDPVAIFGMVEAQRHRERGVSLSMFLGLMKYYRQAYIDLINRDDSDGEKTTLPNHLFTVFSIELRSLSVLSGLNPVMIGRCRNCKTPTG